MYSVLCVWLLLMFGPEFSCYCDYMFGGVFADFEFGLFYLQRDCSSACMVYSK